jgi:glycosyltransferase involved in cell wall biosynthesis
MASLLASTLELRIAGDGELRPALEETARHHSMTNISFLGRVPPAEMAPLIQGASFVVVPSEWYENAPMSILEAFAYGKPVVAARIGGIPELVKDGTTGLLFEPADSDGLRRAIECLISRPDFAVEMGRNARGAVEETCGPERHYEALMEVYRHAGERRRARVNIE